jgi:hypothetical protein
LDEVGYRRTVGGNGADGRLLVLSHKAAVTFDIGTEYCGELTFEVFCSHANTSFKLWEDKLTNAESWSIARAGQAQKYDRLKTG